MLLYRLIFSEFLLNLRDFNWQIRVIWERRSFTPSRFQRPESVVCLLWEPLDFWDGLYVPLSGFFSWIYVDWLTFVIVEQRKKKAAENTKDKDTLHRKHPKVYDTEKCRTTELALRTSLNSLRKSRLGTKNLYSSVFIFLKFIFSVSFNLPYLTLSIWISFPSRTRCSLVCLTQSRPWKLQ